MIKYAFLWELIINLLIFSIKNFNKIHDEEKLIFYSNVCLNKIFRMKIRKCEKLQIKYIWSKFFLLTFGGDERCKFYLYNKKFIYLLTLGLFNLFIVFFYLANIFFIQFVSQVIQSDQ